LLLIIIFYQPIATGIGFRYSNLYALLSPYTLLLIYFIFIFIVQQTLKNKGISKQVFSVCSVSFILILFLIPKYSVHQGFPLNLLKNIQFLWGPLIMIPGLIYFLDKYNFSKQLMYKKLLTFLILIFSIANIFEFLAVNIFGIDYSSIFYLKNLMDVNTIKNTSLFVDFKRPFGLLLYPQPNGYILAFLLLLYFTFNKRNNYIFTAGIIGLIFSFGYTGLLFFFTGFFILSKLKYKILFISIVIPLSLSQFSQSEFLYKFSGFYFIHLFNILSKATMDLLSNFTFVNYIYGTDEPRITATAANISHDWPYLGIFFEMGVIGISLYLLVSYKLIMLSMPIELDKKSSIIITFLTLFFIFHYPSLSFITVQIIISSFIAINIIDKKNIFINSYLHHL